MSRFSSFRVRLMLIIVLAVLPMAGLILYTGLEEQRYAAADALREAMQMTRFASDSQDRSIGEGHHLLSGLAQFPGLWDLNTDACRTLLVAMLKEYERYSNLGLVNRNGDVICSALPMKGLVNIANGPGFQRAMQTREFAIGTYQLGRITGKSMLSLNCPVFDAGGQLQGVLFAALDLGWFNQLAVQTNLPQGSTLKVLDSNGTVLVHYPNPKKWIGKSVAESPIFKAILAQQGRGTAEAAGSDGTPRLYAFTPLRGGHNSADAYVSVGIPTSVAYAKVKYIQNRNLTGLGIITLVVLGLAWAAGHMFILRHVKALVTATRRLAAGDFSVQSGLPYGKGELGQLAQSFDEMAAALKKRGAEVKRAEEALRESEEKYRSLVESTEDSIYLVDRNCTYLFMNKEYLKRFGIKRDKIIGRRYDEFHSKEETKEFKGRVNAVIETGKSRRYVYESERGGGHYLRTLSPVKDLEGNVVAVTVVSKDVTELIKTEEDLRQTNEELFREHNQRKILAKRLIDLLEKDRRQIAMELHDHIGQTLTSLKMDIEMIHGKLKPEQRELGARITAAQEKAIQAIKDIRNISRGLRPGMLDALGLVSSLRELFNEIQQQTDIEIRFFSRGIPERFAPEKELTIYRIVQEAMTNIIRHAKAKNVFVNLVKKDENLSLSVEDDGIGFDQDKVMTFSKKGGPLGLLIMRERAEQLDGEFTLESQIGKGTHVLVEIPL
jgi:PAS domain S-box-containing protein